MENTENIKRINPDVQKIIEWQDSPIAFIKDIWGLVPERDNQKFVKGKYISWHQHDILLGVESAIRKEKPKRISVRSGHGIGKDTTLSWLILWFLFTHKDAQASCTAPTSQQMYDVLWKEVKKWLDMMPKGIRELYDWQASYVRIKERPETWFARAATARKEAPEAFAGVHGENVMFAADEASGIPEEIFESGRGAFTNENALVFLFGNPLRLMGYFYDTHHSQKENWQIFSFSSLDSPLVDKESGLIKEVREKYGEDSDEWRMRVLGQFPREDAVDDKGYVPLLLAEDLRIAPKEHLAGKQLFLGVDPSGEGSNETVWVLRDQYQAKVEKKEQVSNPKSIAQMTLSIITHYNVEPQNVVIDNFGEGANVAQELLYALYKSDDFRTKLITAVNVGEPAESDDFLNKRAECFYRLKQWLRTGGELLDHPDWKQLLLIRYRRELNGKMRIMSKQDMRKLGIESPDCADALSLTFWFGVKPMSPTPYTFKPKLSENRIVSMKPEVRATTFRPKW